MTYPFKVLYSQNGKAAVSWPQILLAYAHDRPDKFTAPLVKEVTRFLRPTPRPALKVQRSSVESPCATRSSERKVGTPDISPFDYIRVSHHYIPVSLLHVSCSSVPHYPACRPCAPHQCCHAAIRLRASGQTGTARARSWTHGTQPSLWRPTRTARCVSDTMTATQPQRLLRTRSAPVKESGGSATARARPWCVCTYAKCYRMGIDPCVCAWHRPPSDAHH